VASVTLRRTCRAGVDSARCDMLNAVAAAATTAPAPPRSSQGGPLDGERDPSRRAGLLPRYAEEG
jgi:hypothetical protein